MSQAAVIGASSSGSTKQIPHFFLHIKLLFFRRIFLVILLVFVVFLFYFTFFFGNRFVNV